jgi:hypothetical protein
MNMLDTIRKLANALGPYFSTRDNTTILRLLVSLATMFAIITQVAEAGGPIVQTLIDVIRNASPPQ